ncbi:hypothetical protein Taro_014976, partial [Colocasia esculenta]|nr:hypothetical protein [Colocasia esculenta]
LPCPRPRSAPPRPRPVPYGIALPLSLPPPESGAAPKEEAPTRALTSPSPLAPATLSQSMEGISLLQLLHYSGMVSTAAFSLGARTTRFADSALALRLGHNLNNLGNTHVEHKSAAVAHLLDLVETDGVQFGRGDECDLWKSMEFNSDSWFELDA